MCDNEGSLGDPDSVARTKAVENHYKWIDAGKYLGCHSIRVNAQSEGKYDQQMKLAADGLSRLIEYGANNDFPLIRRKTVLFISAKSENVFSIK